MSGRKLEIKKMAAPDKEREMIAKIAATFECLQETGGCKKTMKVLMRPIANKRCQDKEVDEVIPNIVAYARKIERLQSHIVTMWTAKEEEKQEHEEMIYKHVYKFYKKNKLAK